jgi:hypothetical protein
MSQMLAVCCEEKADLTTSWLKCTPDIYTKDQAMLTMSVGLKPLCHRKFKHVSFLSSRGNKLQQCMQHGTVFRTAPWEIWDSLTFHKPGTPILWWMLDGSKESPISSPNHISHMTRP